MIEVPHRDRGPSTHVHGTHSQTGVNPTWGRVLELKPEPHHSALQLEVCACPSHCRFRRPLVSREWFVCFSGVQVWNENTAMDNRLGGLTIDFEEIGNREKVQWYVPACRWLQVRVP